MNRIAAITLFLFLALVNYLPYSGYSQQPSFGHRFTSGMVYSSTTQTSPEKGVHKQIRQDVTNIPLSTAPVKHFTVAGAFTVTINSTGTTCGYSNGSFEAAASGGVAPYQYSENGYPYQSSGFFDKKTAGTYVVTAQDATGTTTTATVVLTNTYSLAAVSIQRFVEPSNCAMADGSVTLSPTGGTAPFTFNMDWGSYGNSNTSYSYRRHLWQ